MAEVRYVVLDYTDEDYFEVGSSIGYFEFEYVTAGYVSSVINGTADLTAVFSQSTIPGLIFGVNSNLNSQTQLSALAVKVFGADAQLSATSTITAVALQIIPAVLTLTDGVTLTSIGNAIRSAELNITATSDLTSQAAVIRAGAVDLNAFNSIVTAALRIKPAVDLSGIVFSLTATAYDFTKGSAVFSSVFASTSKLSGPVKGEMHMSAPLPTGLVVDSTHITDIVALYDPLGDFSVSSTLQTALEVTEIAFWLKLNTNQSGCILSSSTLDSYAESTFVNVGFYKNGNDYQLKFTKAFSGGTLGTKTVTWSNVYTSGWHHIIIRLSDSTLWINNGNVGIGSISTTGQSITNHLSNPITLGAQVGVTGDPGGSQRTYAYTSLIPDPGFEIAQIWIGRTGATPGSDISQYFLPYDGEYWDLGTNGKGGYNLTFSKVYFYDPLNYPYTSKAEQSATRRSQYGAEKVFAGAASDITYIPAEPFIAKVGQNPNSFFSLLATGITPVFGNVAISAQASVSASLGRLTAGGNALIQSTTGITARLGYVRSESANIQANSALVSTINFLLPSNADLNAVFTLSASAIETSSGEILGPTAFNLTAKLTQVKNDGLAILTASATIIADSTTNSLGIVDMQTSCNLIAEPRVTYPIRPELMIMSAAFSLTPNSRRFRDSLISMPSEFILSNGITQAIRNGSASMSAFDTVLSAGKIIEFLAENTIQVTEEQRLLKVALESTLLLVEMANGVNIVMAESTDTKVAQEQGLLLAQYNTPN